MTGIHRNLQSYCCCLGLTDSVTIKLLSIHMVLNDLSVTFIPTEVLKHSRKGKPLDKFEYKTLCLTVCLKEYISRRNKHERLITLQLIITLRKPFKGAPIDILR